MDITAFKESLRQLGIPQNEQNLICQGCVKDAISPETLDEMLDKDILDWLYASFGAFMTMPQRINIKNALRQLPRNQNQGNQNQGTQFQANQNQGNQNQGTQFQANQGNQFQANQNQGNQNQGTQFQNQGNQNQPNTTQELAIYTTELKNELSHIMAFAQNQKDDMQRHLDAELRQIKLVNGNNLMDTQIENETAYQKIHADNTRTIDRVENQEKKNAALEKKVNEKVYPTYHPWTGVCVHGLNWTHCYNGGPTNPIYCCHATINAKHLWSHCYTGPPGLCVHGKTWPHCSQPF